MIGRPHFRFEDLEIWQLARDLAVRFHQIAQRLDEDRFYKITRFVATRAEE